MPFGAQPGIEPGSSRGGRAIHNSRRDRGQAIGTPGEVSARAAAQAGPGRKVAVLVAASPVNRIVISRILERCGLRVIAAEPPSTAHACAREPVAMVVLDCKGDGSEHEDLLAKLTGLGSTNGGAPRIVLLATKSARAEASANGIDAVLAKPVTEDKLQPLVERLLAAAPAS